MWDAIVIGSGVGGLAAAAALSRRGRRVLVLEQHSVAGGLTQTFDRGDWRFATGVHYIGGVGAEPGREGQFGRLLAWLGDGSLQFTPCANPYDIVHLPDLEFGIAHPESAYHEALLKRFPEQRSAIDGWFEACEDARQSAFMLFALRSLPAWAAWGMRQWRGHRLDRWLQRTVAEQIGSVADPRLRAVLGTRWADYGQVPERAPFAMHALVTGSYNAGAYYPVGGPARIAQSLTPAITSAGGELRTGCDVQRILIENDRVCGVAYEHADRRHTEPARLVISDIGLPNTVACLPQDVAVDWQAAVSELTPGIGYVALYVGLEGDVAAAGADAANHWIHEGLDISALWRSPADTDAPGLFVAFPTQKDPTCSTRPTAEIVTCIDPAVFAPWLNKPDGPRAPDYLALKALIEERLLQQFLRHFPALRPLVRFHELATPLSQRHFVRSPAGAMYGLEMTAKRMASPALHVRSPVPGLLLAGQDVISPGLQGAFMGGLLAAAWAEPTLWTHLA